MKKLADYFLDFLMFVVPILELSDILAIIPPEWLPWYMITTVVLRRLLRIMEERNVSTQTPVE